MPVDSHNPGYDFMIGEWCLMRDAYAGETVIKSRGDVYLKPTPSMVLDGYKLGSVGRLVDTVFGQGVVTSAPINPTTLNKGTLAYEAYKDRAVFHEFVTDAVKYFVGMLNQKPPTIELPAVMEPLMKKATNQGESLVALLRKIHSEQLTTGRLGLLIDMPPEPDPKQPMPYIAVYAAENIINWDDSSDNIGVNSLDLVILDESGPRRRVDYTWKDVKQFRILQMRFKNEFADGIIAANAAQAEKAAQAKEAPPEPLMDPDSVITVDGADKVYKQAVVESESGVGVLDPMQFFPPVFRGKAMDEIPFIIVNSSDINSGVDYPPMIGLGRLCLTIYRLEADYRQALFMQGQDTLVTIGGIIDPETGAAANNLNTTQDGVRVGAGARLDLNTGGDAKYIGTQSEGLPEMREALAADKKAAETKSGQLIAPTAGKQESGDALSTRLSAQTASLQQIAKTSALALENALKKIAMWVGADPEKVKVTPNLEFIDQRLVAKDLVDLMTARSLGAPMALETVHDFMSTRGITEKTFEEEMALVEEEDMADVKKKAKEFAQIPAGAPGGMPLPPAPGGAGAGAPPAKK